MENLYIFLDEAGNFDFSKEGTKYLIFTTLTTINPFEIIDEFCRLRDYLIRNEFEIRRKLAKKGVSIEKINERLNFERFHATEDLQLVRDKVFEILSKDYNFTIDSEVVEKAKVNPSIREPEIFYSKIYRVLLSYIFRRYDFSSLESINIYTDIIPVKRKREAVEKGIKSSIKELLKEHKIVFHLRHHDSKSNVYLQAVDYCAWAIYKKWTSNEERPHRELIEKLKIKLEVSTRFLRGVKLLIIKKRPT